MTVLIKPDKLANFRVRTDLMDEDLPSIWLEAQRKSHKNLLIGTFYREWRSRDGDLSIELQKARLEQFGNQMEKASREGKPVIVGGDMNIDLNRIESGQYHLSSLWNTMEALLDSCGLNLSVIRDTFTRELVGLPPVKSSLDHVYYSSPFTDSVTKIANGISDHCPILMEIPWDQRSARQQKVFPKLQQGSLYSRPLYHTMALLGRRYGCRLYCPFH